MKGDVVARPGQVDLEIENLCLNAGGLANSRRLFEAVTFRVAAGQRWVVIGPNGAGKSSLLAAIAGVFPIAAGDVRFGVGFSQNSGRADAAIDAGTPTHLLVYGPD